MANTLSGVKKVELKKLITELEESKSVLYKEINKFENTLNKMERVQDNGLTNWSGKSAIVNIKKLTNYFNKCIVIYDNMENTIEILNKTYDSVKNV